MTAPYVLMYHSIDHFDEDPYLITIRPGRFAEQMAWLARRGLRGVSVRELLRAPAPGLVGLTFDDAYADFGVHALPVLLRHGFTATVFVVAGRLGGTNDWDPLGPRKPLMDREDVLRAADAGMEIGSHTLTHLRLAGADPFDVEQEVKGSKAVLEEIVGGDVAGLAYPYGDHDADAVEAVRAAGYAYACSINPAGPGPHTLPRTYIGQRDRWLRLHAKRAVHRWKSGRGG
ncbi:polysaccharide deacetylase family protein [Nonomuraea longicatena]|uniref:Polysaccharide deacetylase family protein n=1 Tax=Nonomuraea longicatena TaxID=83682 RepID=A0ABP3ZN37_9ACTN